MGKMRRLLAAVLVASMLFGTNGVSYAAETIADGASQETTVEETTEAVTEDTESAAPAESDPSETVDAVTQTGAEDSSQDDSEAAEEVADTESDADDKAAASDNETDASETDKANDAAVSETGDAGNDAETPEAGSSTEVAEEVPAEVTYSAGKLEFNGDDYGKDYSVTLTYDADAEIPADAQLKVTEIEKDKEQEKYEAYLKEANAAVENSVTDARFFDIKIMVGDEEIQPKSAVKVNISYKEAIEVEEKAEVQAVHFDEEKDEPVPVEIETNNGDKVDEVEFEAKTFSVYAVLYTVDFNYTDHAFSIPGGSNIRLSELAQKLGFYAESETKEFSVQDVVNVTFTNSELVKTEKQEDGDWMLTSLKAFSTKETLTIDMANGDQFVVDVTDAQDALTVNINMYDYEDSSTVEFPGNFGGDDHVYLIAWAGDSDYIKEVTDGNTPWAIVDISDIKGHDSPYEVTVDKFSKDQWNTNFNVNYSDLGADQERLKVRVVHSNRTMNDLSLGRLLQLGNAQNESEIEEYETLWSGFGTEFPISKEHPTKQITTGENVVNFKFGNTLDHEVVLQFEGSPEAIPEGKYYAWLSAKSLNGQKTYHYVVPLHADGSSEMHIPFSGNWTEQQPFSNNWKDISAQIIAAMPGKTIQAGGNIPGENTYSITPIMKGFTCTYVGRETSVDPDNHVQHDEFVIKLTKNEYEKALDPYDVLGDGAEYGVIANKYTQANDSETNFAAKIFENETGDALKVGEKGAAGTNIVPFYVGQVTGNNNLRIGQDTTNDCDVYINNTQQDRVTNEESKITVNKIPMSQSDINEVVQGFIDKLQDSSEKYAGKTTYTPVFPEGSLKRDIDTTMFPDGKTIHINADNVNLSQGGGTIYKLPGQTIVFNMTGTDVTVSEFYVQEVNEDGTLKGEKVFSNTDGNGGSREKNLRIEEAILDHIVFNAPNAKFFKVNSGPAGLFLVPDDEAYVSEPGGSGTGWIATAGEFYQKGGEWHFFRTKRKYKSEGDFSLSGQKKITDAANNEKPFADYKSLDYEFELYKSNESGAITDADAIEKVKADESGAFSFTSLKLTQVEVPEGQRKTFYYIIKEVVPTQDNLLGVIYNAKDVHVRVVAQDDSSGNITFTVSKRTKDGEQFGEWVNVENTGADDKKVYELGDFVNTLKKGSLEVTKRVNGNDAKGTYEIAVKDTNGNYYDLDGNVTETKPYYVSFAKNDTKEWKNLIGGKYIVEEKDANAEGYTWSVSGTGVEISVGSGCVQSAEVTNTYVKHVKEHFEVTKNFTGRAWKDGDSFEFTLAGVSAKDEENNDITPIPMPSGSLKQNATSTSKTATFGDIEYSQAGTYTYSITETNGGLPGVTYDTEPHTVTVVVTMNPETKELSAEVDYDKGDESLEITNTYAASGEGEVKVKKVLEGRDWTDTDSFTFTLTGKSAPVGVETVPMPAETSITIKKSDENQTKSFGKIEFTKAGTYTYTVKETKGSLGGVSYDETEHTVTIEVVDNGQGKLVAKEGTQLIQTETITNTYTAASTKGEVKVKKVLNGREWTTSDEFTFTISKGADAPADQPMPAESSITIKKSDADQTKSFGEITFTKKGTYTYIVKETKGSLGGVSYDETEHTVTIEVVDNGQGKLVAKENTQLIQTETITNTYTAASTKGEVKVKKVLNGRDWTDDDEFTFTLTGKSAPEGVETVPMPAETSITIKKSDADQTKSFGEIEFTKAGTYTYIVKETKGSLGGVSYDETEHTVTIEAEDDGKGHIIAKEGTQLIQTEKITNTYAAAGEIVLHAQKELLGARKLEEGQFTFILKDADGKPLQTKPNAADGSVTFDAINYTQDDIYDVNPETGVYSGADTKTYTYTISEEIPKEAKDNGDGTFDYQGYTYDGTVHTVDVQVKDNGDGTITAEIAKAADAETPAPTEYVFTNAYDADGTLKLNAEKTFKNGTLHGGEFTFELMDKDGKVLQSKKNDAAGNVSFDMITYKLADAANAPFTYTVREVPGSRTDVKYDATVYTVTVSLEDNGDGTLKVTKKIDNGGALKFVNEQLNVETSVTIEGVKVLEGKTLKNDQFKFVLADADGKWVDTATNDADGNFTFKPITYKLSDLNGEKAKVFTYGVSEVKGSESGITYDEKVYTVKVTVTDNGDGTMTAKADLAKKDIKFVNKAAEKKTKKKDNTKTGDEAPLGVLFGGLGFGAAGLAVLLEDRKRRNKNR